MWISKDISLFCSIYIMCKKTNMCSLNGYYGCSYVAILSYVIYMFSPIIYMFSHMLYIRFRIISLITDF